MATPANAYYFCGDASDDPTGFCCPETSSERKSRNRKRALPVNHPAVQLPPGVLDPYAVLAVRRDATSSEVRRAFERLALLHHPSRQRGCFETFSAIAAAYETLSCATSRQRMDDILFHKVSNDNLPVIPSRGRSNVTISSAEDHDDDGTLNNVVYSPLSAFTSATDSSFMTTVENSDVHQDRALFDPLECVCRGENSTKKKRLQMTESFHDDPNNDIGTPSSHRVKDSPNRKSRMSNDLPALMKPSTSSTTCDEDPPHYSEAATDRLFGGPLQFMFRARRWQPFTDPYEVFQRVFGSSLGVAGPGKRSNNKIPSNVRTAVITPAHAANWNSETQSLPNGTFINRNSKTMYDHRTIVRTVTRFQEPSTGYTRTTIEVTTNEPTDVLDMSVPNSVWCGSIMCLGSETADAAAAMPLYHHDDIKSRKNSDGSLTEATEPADDDEWSFASACQAWLPSCA